MDRLVPEPTPWDAAFYVLDLGGGLGDFAHTWLAMGGVAAHHAVGEEPVPPQSDLWARAAASLGPDALRAEGYFYLNEAVRPPATPVILEGPGPHLVGRLSRFLASLG